MQDLLFYIKITYLYIVNNNIKGDISNIIDGEFKKDNRKVNATEISISLKNSSSLNKFNIKTKLNIIKKTNSKDLK